MIIDFFLWKPLVIWFQKLISQWAKPAPPSPFIGVFSDLTRSRINLVVENPLLRQQLIVLNRQVRRPQFTNYDRFLLILLACCTRFWIPALHIVQPDTLLRWHRELFRLCRRRKSMSKLNQPKDSTETIALIRKMAEENHLWGAERFGANC